MKCFPSSHYSEAEQEVANDLLMEYIRTLCKLIYQHRVKFWTLYNPLKTFKGTLYELLFSISRLVEHKQVQSDLKLSHSKI